MVVVRPRLIALVPGGHIEIIFEFSEDRCGISAGGREVGLTLFLLALARRQAQLTGDDLVEDDLEDRRIAIETETEGGDA